MAGSCQQTRGRRAADAWPLSSTITSGATKQEQSQPTNLENATNQKTNEVAQQGMHESDDMQCAVDISGTCSQIIVVLFTLALVVKYTTR